MHTPFHVIQLALVQAICAQRGRRTTTTTHAGPRKLDPSSLAGLAHPEESCAHIGRKRTATHMILAGAMLALCAGALVDQNHTETAVLQTELRGVREDISEIKTTIQSLSQAMLMLVRVEQVQAHTQARVGEMGQTLQSHGERIAGIEKDMPGLKDLRKWVIAGVAAVCVATAGAFLNGNLTVSIGPKAVVTSGR